ncbi:DUF2935 domain-containing protein [Paenibacillus flagellatus]|uniref:DUF2935 domain-containing protein n=1 Tax=Paenibacillus flagellatus TaxID=2211139 RepID=A0A2V5K9J8_9BACL|nr:DUF2935 domain-containing protein [Paenibacillus flagellatus]PYI56215.1 hypothetical protein DLM86_04295 [Paenibacillus flagellatus]
MGTYEQSALFEHRFWLQVLGDHSRFIRDALAPKEAAEIARAGQFVAVFDGLLERARKELAGAELATLNAEATARTSELRAFKLHLLNRHLTGSIAIGLSPSFLNHMVNELEEYVRVLAPLSAGKPAPLFHPVHYHLVWLQDAYGHAASITADLDMAEKKLQRDSRAFEKQFEHFYLKAVEMAGYLRTNATKFPALAKFNVDVEMEMLLFMKFLRELEEMDVSRELLGTIAPLMADHMAREECYYLTKLSLVSNVGKPDCDPTAKRIEG